MIKIDKETLQELSEIEARLFEIINTEEPAERLHSKLGLAWSELYDFLDTYKE